VNGLEPPVSGDRLARWLLHIYPRPWRDRYGDEFLALVADTGLTWSGALDIAAAALVQRSRYWWMLSLGRVKVDIAPGSTFGPANAREFGQMLAEVAVALAMMAVTVVALGRLGLLPPWEGNGIANVAALMWATQIWVSWLQFPQPPSGVDRVALVFGRFVAAILVTGAAWSIGGTLVLQGIPLPADAVAYTCLFGFFLAAAARACARLLRTSYRVRRASATPPSWISWLEIRIWTAAGFGLFVLAGMMDTDSTRTTFWTCSCLCYGWLGLMRLKSQQRTLARV
jgi:hypothetical protein